MRRGDHLFCLTIGHRTASIGLSGVKNGSQSLSAKIASRNRSLSTSSSHSGSAIAAKSLRTADALPFHQLVNWHRGSGEQWGGRVIGCLAALGQDALPRVFTLGDRGHAAVCLGHEGMPPDVCPGRSGQRGDGCRRLRAAGTTMVLAAEMGRTTVGLITWWLWATESKDLSIKYGPVGFKALRSASVV